MDTAAKSFVKNSLVIGRGKNGERAIFNIDSEGGAVVQLDGYVIVPKERIPELEAFKKSLLPAAAP